MQVDPSKAVAAVKGFGSQVVKVVRVHTVDGQSADVAINERQRYRWKRLSETLDSFDWARLEALDDKGNIVGVLDNANAGPDDSFDVGALDAIGDETGGVGDVAQLTRIMLAAQDLALKRNNEHTRDLLNASVDLLRSYAQQLATTQQALYNLQEQYFAVSQQFAQQQGGGMDTESMLIQALGPKLMNGNGTNVQLEAALQKVGPDIIRQAMTTPKNGAK